MKLSRQVNNLKHKNNIPVFLSSDNNYAPFVATTIASICDNTKSFVDFYILDGGITAENQEKIRALKDIFNNFSIRFIKIDTEKEFSEINYKNNEYITLSTYNRFLIPQLCPDLDKVLYLDVDIVVMCDILQLYKIDLENFALGAAWDKSRILYNTDTYKPMNLSDNYKYFNAGVLLIDVKKWNKNNIVRELFKIEKQYGGNVLHADETLLNKYFDNNYKIFDIKYNYTDYDIVNSPNGEIAIRHFASAMKPWNSNYCMLLNKAEPLLGFEEFWRYAKMTKFYDKLIHQYNCAINKNLFTKRMSILADKIKKERNIKNEQKK